MKEIEKEPRLNRQDEVEFLDRYNADDFAKPSVTVDILLFTIGNGERDNYRTLPEKYLQVLLVKRGEYPYKGYWALPGGFVQIDESIDATANRVLQREANVRDVYLEQLYTWGEVQRDPRMRVISCSYMSLVNNESMEIKPGEGQSDAAWFTIRSKVIKEINEITEVGLNREEHIQLTFSNEKETFSVTVKKTEKIQQKQSQVSIEVLQSDHIAFDHARIVG